MPESTSRIGSSIKAARRAQGLSQSALAALASVSSTTILELEAGRSSVLALVAVLGALDARVVGLPRGNTLHARIRNARIRRGLSLESLARRAGVSKSALLRLETANAHIATLEAVLGIVAPGFRLQQHEVVRWTASGDRDSRFTPATFLESLTIVLGEIDLDPCAHPASPVLAHRRLFEADDGLKHEWSSEGLVFVNPPFSRTAQFVAKGFEEWRSGRARLIAFLLKAKTDGSQFHDLLVPHGDMILLRHRVKYLGPEGGSLGKASVPFPSMLCVLGATPDQVAGLKANFRGLHVGPTGAGWPRNQLWGLSHKGLLM